MAALFENLTWEDKTTLTLRSIFEQYGYKRYRMEKFEPYDMYRENRNFLKSETVITFSDASGRLMALKPDVTMSIVKNTLPETVSQKLYYIENVFRMAPGSHEYKEISQIGLESIGSDDGYSEAETVLLALKSLEAICDDFLLSIGHMGFISAVLAACGFDSEGEQLALNALRHKNLHELMDIAEQRGIAEENKKLLETMTGISAPVKQALETLSSLPLDEDMLNTLDEIRCLYMALAAVGYEKYLRLDFALINDLDYYNGIVFQGYIPNLPRAVLSGGRYDNLMRKFDKPQSAIGFALYLGELTRVFKEYREYDADVLVIYGDTAADAVLRAVVPLLSGEKIVRIEKNMLLDIRAKEILVLNNDGKLEARRND